MAVVILLLAGCATAPQRDSAVDQTAVDALLIELDEVVASYEADIAALQTVDAGAAEQALDVHAGQLRALGLRCSALAGCNEDRVFGAFERVNLVYRRALLGHGEGFAAVNGEADTASEPEAREHSQRGGPAAVLPESSRTVTQLNGRELNELIELNPQVQSALVEWLTWMRPNLITTYENYQYMRHLMWPEYERAGLPEALLFGIMAKESGGRVHSVSRAGASGPLQFMYATGLRYGLGRVDGFDTRFDPQLSTRANVAYLNDRFRELDNDLALALAAYNGGEGRMRRLFESTGKPFWDPQVFAQLPRETQDYVPMVLAAAWLFLHPERYGLEFPQLAADPANFTLVRDATLNELTLCLGQGGTRDGWFRALRNLNPRYEPHTSIKAGTTMRSTRGMADAYAQRCVEGEHAQLAAQLAATNQPTAATAGLQDYTVRRGDSLHAISRKHACEVGRLAAENRIRGPRYLIRPGQKLRLTGCRR